ncbi:MAG: hypothetical protein HND44_05790 [Chloroflexi bacterium]|nr:hypothetical protein [Ardenticatenaceae bacterium]NOG34071.1 hypothetical protein [Chloroflexota bacterium]
MTRTEIDQIIRMPNLILRNLRITQAYHAAGELAAGMLSGCIPDGVL